MSKTSRFIGSVLFVVNVVMALVNLFAGITGVINNHPATLLNLILVPVMLFAAYNMWELIHD